MFLEILKFIFFSLLIVLISKYMLVTVLRKLAENLNLKPNVIGNIAGYATSVPELLTVSISSFTGLTGASVYNILSSNIINLVQYICAIIMNNNLKKLKNEAIIIDIILVLFTIFIPIFILITDMEINVIVVLIFLVLAFVFWKIDNLFHKKFLNDIENKIIQIENEKEKEETKNNKSTFLYIFLLVLAGVLLFFIGNMLGDTLEVLAEKFNISQTIIGILLGFITSIPELITFIESQRYYKEEELDDILGVVEATNNLFTSNVLNLFIIQSIGVCIFLIWT